MPIRHRRSPTPAHQAKPAADEKWEPLGVFAMVKGDEQTSNDIFQLAMNKDGVIRGNYYNALTDTRNASCRISRQKAQRVAWTIGDKNTRCTRPGSSI